MKKLLCAVLALALAASLAGCGGDKENKESSTDGKSESTGAEQEALADELVVYSPLSPKLLQAAAEGFTASTGTKVQLVSDSSQALFTRMANGASPKADVLFGAGAEVVRERAELFAPYASAQKDKLDPIFLPDDDLYTPFTPVPIVLMYNKSQTTQAPSGWANIINESYRGWVAFASPKSSGTSYTALAVTQQLKQVLGSEYMNSFCTSIAGKMMNNITDVYKAVAGAEFAVGVTLETSAQKYIEAGYENSVGISYPEEGTTAALEVSAIAAGTEKEDDAKAFIDYVSGEEFQKKLVGEFKMRTARSDIDDPEGLIPRKDIVFMEYDVEKAVSERQSIIKKFTEAEEKATAALTKDK